MTNLLLDAIYDHNKIAEADIQNNGNINVKFGYSCFQVCPSPNNPSRIIVKAKNLDSSTILLQASLVVGADGLNSKVK